MEGIEWIEEEEIRKVINAVEEIIYERPLARREFDQIPMLLGDALRLVFRTSQLVADKDVGFLGDFDCFSLLFSYLEKLGVTKAPKHILVLDFDERLLNFIRKFSRQRRFEDKIETYLYNVVDPLPTSLHGKVDLFWTNPPYGSKNEGRSGDIFLSRCLEIIKGRRSGGYVLNPLDHSRDWTEPVMAHLQSYMGKAGFAVMGMPLDQYRYHLDDARFLASRLVMFSLREKIPRVKYLGKYVPREALANFYGEEQREIPHYIRDNRTQLGKVESYNPPLTVPEAKKELRFWD